MVAISKGKAPCPLSIPQGGRACASKVLVRLYWYLDKTCFSFLGPTHDSNSIVLYSLRKGFSGHLKGKVLIFFVGISRY